MEPLVFMHIPKTGGTGIDFWLDASFRNQGFWYPSDYITPRTAEVPPCRAVFGHCPANLEGRYVTLLRDPVERVISLYYAHMDYGNYPYEGLSLPEYVEQAPYEEIDNGIVRRLAGGLDLDKARARLEEFAFVTTVPERLVLWITERIKLPFEAFYERLNINRRRPRHISGEVRDLIEAKNALDVVLFQEFSDSL